MKIIQFLVTGLLLSAALCRGQDDQEAPYGGGWFSPNPPETTPVAFDSKYHSSGLTAPPQVPGGTGAIAEVITPQITALARGMENDPKRIFDYVHDHIRYVHYFGSHKGAQLTLLEQSGNDFDQCALLVALLRAANFSPTYQFGVVSFPYTSTDHQDYQHWVGTLTNTDWNSNLVLANKINNYGGFPFPYAYLGPPNLLLIQHVWVQVAINGTNFVMDPSFKVSELVSGIDLAAAMGLNITNLLNGAGGTSNANYVQGLSESSVRSNLQSCATTLMGTLQNSYPSHSVQQIVGGWQVVSSSAQPLGQTTAFTIQDEGGDWPVSTWNYIPTNLMAVLKVSLMNSTNIFYTPNLKGDRLSLTFSTGRLAQLWLQDTQVGSSIQTPTTTNSVNVTMTFQHPFGNWNLDSNTLMRSNWCDESYSRSYQSTNSSYALLYAFDAAPALLTARQRQLEAYRQQGLADTSRQVQTETLNVMGLSWLVQTEMAQELLDRQMGVMPLPFHRVGRMGQEAGCGYYIDIFADMFGGISGAGTDAACLQAKKQVFQGGSYFFSAFEHSIIEQLQSSNLTAASTVKILQIANTNGQKIYLANSNNWTSISSQFTNYDLNDLYTRFIARGYSMLLPANGKVQLAGTGSWAGSGYVSLLEGSNGSQDMWMTIDGGYNGGYVDKPGATADPGAVSQVGANQPNFYSSESPNAALNPAFSLDPVSMADGTFNISTSDLTLGGPEPRGLNLTRYYSSSRRNSNLAAMAPGWLHSYVCNATEVPAPLSGLGATTPQQMVPMLVATRALLGVYDGSYNPKRWAVTALIAKWGVDQLTKSGVSVSLGEDTLQFIKQPNGTLTPPANCTATLIKTNSAYWLGQRHGSTFKFDALGRLTNIVDQYNQQMKLTYDSSNRVYTVTDWKGRALTFNYTGARLTSVGDGTRSVVYGYANTYSSQGDLTSVTDPESKTSTYVYDTNHQTIATFDALSQLVVSNVYDIFGHVTTQYTQGDTNKAWQFYWSGWQTVEQNPAGGKRQFFYDDKTRLIAQQDALGNLAQMAYDGQDHLVMSISPLNETNQAVYDGHHNMVLSIDPLNHTNVFNYDSQDRLLSTVDGRGNWNFFGYNAQFSRTGVTNGAGDWVTYDYNPDGTLHTRTDSGGATTYGYDTTYAQLNNITYPNSLGSESFVTSAFGDITSHTDARNFITTFQYNNRRQLTNTIAPTNVTASVTFDAVGNVQSTKDARGFATALIWSPTGKLLSTTLPTTPQGVPVITNIYDNRDWLTKTLNPLLQPVSYTRDAAERLVAVSDPLSRTNWFGFDGDGRQVSATNALFEKTCQLLDACGQLTVLTDNANHTVQRGYDAAGNQILLTNRNGKVWQFQFDGANRLINTLTPLNHQTTVSFNHQGLPETVKDPKNLATTLFYDAKARLTNRTDAFAGTGYSYDANDNRTNVVENGLTNSWTYDAYNRVSSYRDVCGNLIQYRFDANGNLTNLIYPGGKNVYYSYDSLNRMTNVTDWAQRKTGITYDLASRVKSITRPNGTYRTMSYDAAGQVTNIIEQMPNTLPIALWRYNWKASGMMDWEFAAPLPHPTTAPTRTMTYDDDNRLQKFNGGSVVNDDNGNLTSGPLTNDTFFSYAYDSRNRLMNAGGITNVYDALNNRIAQNFGTNQTIYVVNPVALSQVLMRIKNGVTNYYVYGLGLLYEADDAGNTKIYHYDSRGSTVAITSGNGAVTDRIEYSAYGLTTYRTGTTDTPFLFNGRYGVQTDPNGLLYMRARYYNPLICRFINPDPSGFCGGLNFYAFAGGNPVNLIDPFGLCSMAPDIWARAMNTPADLMPTSSGDGSVLRAPDPDLSTYSALNLGGPPNRQLAEANANAIVTAVPGEILIGSAVKAVSGVVRASVAAENGMFEILDGVRRAKAADLVGNSTIPAQILDAEGRVIGTQNVPISQLLSPKSSIDVSTSVNMDRFMNTLNQTKAGSVPPPITITPGVNGTAIPKVPLDALGPN